jgi:hypothetical protein
MAVVFRFLWLNLLIYVCCCVPTTLALIWLHGMGRVRHALYELGR